jgi:hypothetical protein
MSRQAQLGLFAVLALVLLFGIFYVITDFGTRHSGYRLGVHFATSSGLPTGAEVFFSGVTVGTVDQVSLLPDNTVEVVLAIQNNVNIPKGSRFEIEAPITGSANLFIHPPIPRPLPANYVATPTPVADIWPHRVLPLSEQPVGYIPPSLNDFMQEGQAEFKRIDLMLAMLQTNEPKLLGSLQTTLVNVNDLTGQLKGTLTDLSTTMDSTLRQTGANLVALTGTLNGTLDRNQYKIDTLLSSLDATAIALNKSMDQLQTLASDPRLKGNLITTTSNIRDLTANIAGITSDLHGITGNPQTQAQLRDTVANLDATVPSGPATPPGYGIPPGTATPAPANAGAVGSRLGHIAANLFALQLRLGYLSRQTVPSTTPLLSNDRGPQADVNALILPHGNVSILAGANDLGGHTTANLAGMKNFPSGLRVGGGILYSQLGALASYKIGKVGASTRIYDLRRPTVDVYGNFRVNTFAKLFLGERDSTRPDRRTVLGLQLQF